MGSRWIIGSGQAPGLRGHHLREGGHTSAAQSPGGSTGMQVAAVQRIPILWSPSGPFKAYPRPHPRPHPAGSQRRLKHQTRAGCKLIWVGSIGCWCLFKATGRRCARHYICCGFCSCWKACGPSEGCRPDSGEMDGFISMICRVQIQ